MGENEGMSARYRFGIEEEYFLADAATGHSPVRAVAEVFHRAAHDKVEVASRELLTGQVEVHTDPETDFDIARQRLREMRATLAEAAKTQGLLLFAAGTHPLGLAEDQTTTPSERYRRIDREFGIITHRTMVCATHVHVEVPDPGRRLDLMNRLMPYLPLFLALSVSSPFWQGRDSGLKSFRLAVFAEWPRMGLPEVFSTQAEFDRFARLLVETKTIEDASFIWWLIRPSIKYPTLEMRICDSCTNVDDVVAISALYRCLVRAAFRRPDLNAGIGPVERGICAENIWQAQHDGMAARFIDTARGTLVAATAQLDETIALVREDAAALGCADWLEKTRDIAARGTSADRQLAVFRDAGGADAALRAAIGHLAKETAG